MAVYLGNTKVAMMLGNEIINIHNSALVPNEGGILMSTKSMLKKIVLLSQAQYDDFNSTDTLDPDILYLTPVEELPPTAPIPPLPSTLPPTSRPYWFIYWRPDPVNNNYTFRCLVCSTKPWWTQNPNTGSTTAVNNLGTWDRYDIWVSEGQTTWQYHDTGTGWRRCNTELQSLCGLINGHK